MSADTAPLMAPDIPGLNLSIIFLDIVGVSVALLDIIVQHNKRLTILYIRFP